MTALSEGWRAKPYCCRRPSAPSPCLPPAWPPPERVASQQVVRPVRKVAVGSFFVRRTTRLPAPSPLRHTVASSGSSLIGSGAGMPGSIGGKPCAPTLVWPKAAPIQACSTTSTSRHLTPFCPTAAIVPGSTGWKATRPEVCTAQDAPIRASDRAIYIGSSSPSGLGHVRRAVPALLVSPPNTPHRPWIGFNLLLLCSSLQIGGVSFHLYTSRGSEINHLVPLQL